MQTFGILNAKINKIQTDGINSAVEKAKTSEENAQVYMENAQKAALAVFPKFYIDLTDGCLKSETEPQNVGFEIRDGDFIGIL
jgi:anaerobic ribonucleoside-triphosphate reductase